MTRPLELSRKEAEALGLVGRKPRRIRQPKLKKPTLREEEISAMWARYAVNDRESWWVMITIPSPPRTKKNSTDVITTPRGRKLQLQSKAYYQFADDVRAVILPRRKLLRAPLPGRLHICAQFYCDNAAADEKNLEQALADALQKATLVENDQQFESWDGSRRHIDKKRPRVEIVIRPLR